MSDYDSSSIDDALEDLVAQVNEHSLELPITLSVNGSLISGFLICEEAYFEAEALLFGRIGGGNVEAAKAIAAIYARKRPSQNQFRSPQTIKYAHLKVGRAYVEGGKGIPNEGAVWRVKMASIDAYFFGSLVVS